MGEDDKQKELLPVSSKVHMNVCQECPVREAQATLDKQQLELRRTTQSVISRLAELYL